ncbi:S-adenosyl-L-methionine-dependent methyltransferase [Irpex lacteus]|nr:S-adenosyl-L-methionine-dependent methyltransferase [Irpex lacteus]
MIDNELPQSHKLCDYLSANEAYFDAEALKSGDHDHPPKVQLAKRVCNAIRKTYPGLLDEDTTEVMDFACGTGLISRELCPYVKSIVGVDISHNAVDVYNTRARQQGLEPEEMRAVCVNLVEEEEELKGARFDVIISVASYHHLPDIHVTSRILSSLLKPSGSLFIADILNENVASGSDQPELLENYKDIVVHTNGFTEDEIRENIRQAGLQGFDFRVVTSASLHGRTVKFFLARGIKLDENVAK